MGRSDGEEFSVSVSDQPEDWRDRKQRTNRRSETMRRKEEQAAEVRARSAAAERRRKISSQISSGRTVCAAGALAVRRGAAIDAIHAWRLCVALASIEA